MFAVSYIDNDQEPRERLLPHIYESHDKAESVAIDISIRKGFYTNVWDLNCPERFALDGSPL